MRCKSCNYLFPIRTTVKENKKILESMCSTCRKASRDIYRYTEDHQFVLENAEEGLTEPIPTEDY